MRMSVFVNKLTRLYGQGHPSCFAFTFLHGLLWRVAKKKYNVSMAEVDGVWLGRHAFDGHLTSSRGKRRWSGGWVRCLHRALGERTNQRSGIPM